MPAFVTNGIKSTRGNLARGKGAGPRSLGGMWGGEPLSSPRRPRPRRSPRAKRSILPGLRGVPNPPPDPPAQNPPLGPLEYADLRPLRRPRARVLVRSGGYKTIWGPCPLKHGFLLHRPRHSQSSSAPGAWSAPLSPPGPFRNRGLGTWELVRVSPEPLLSFLDPFREADSLCHRTPPERLFRLCPDFEAICVPCTSPAVSFFPFRTVSQPCTAGGALDCPPWAPPSRQTRRLHLHQLWAGESLGARSLSRGCTLLGWGGGTLRRVAPN